MSGIALVWASNVKGLKPNAKMVLVQLADFHNKETGQCNPSAQRLADECEMDRATVFRHLKDLEALGLLTRHSRGDGAGGRSSNQYELHLDVVLGPSSKHKEKSQNATRGVVAECDGGSGTSATGVVANCDTNLNIEPGTEPHKGRVCSFSQFWEVWPNRNAKARAEKAWKKLTPSQRQEATDSAKAWYAAWRQQYPTASDMLPASYLNGRRWEDEGWQKSGNVDQAKRAAMIAEWKASSSPAVRAAAAKMEAGQ